MVFFFLTFLSTCLSFSFLLKKKKKHIELISNFRRRINLPTRILFAKENDFLFVRFFFFFVYNQVYSSFYFDEISLYFRRLFIIRIINEFTIIDTIRIIDFVIKNRYG